MITLGVDCTAKAVSCAVMLDGTIVSEYYLNNKTTHSQTLMPMIESSLSLAGLKVGDIDVFAISAGPGSFTGVRIGISAVKGLAEPLCKPCVPVSVLEAMAYAVKGFDCIVCSVMDARCSQVYNALFSSENGEITRLCCDRALAAGELQKEIAEITEKNGEKLIFLVGDGAEMFYNEYVNGFKNVRVSPENIRMQRASCVCTVAEKEYHDSKSVTAEELLPIYLRVPQAERELKAKKERDRENGKL